VWRSMTSSTSFFDSKWFLLLGSAACWLNVWTGLTTGSVMLVHQTVRRSERRYQFWFGVWFSAAVGIIALVAVIHSFVQQKP